METIDDETVAAAKILSNDQVKDGKPFFVWWNGTRMHFRTHVKDEHEVFPDRTNTAMEW